MEITQNTLKKFVYKLVELQNYHHVQQTEKKLKKTLIATLLSLSAVSSFAASYVSVDAENVSGRNGGMDSKAQYLRAGKEIGGIQWGIQDRTAKFTNGTVINSMELTAGKSFGFIQPFVGIGHDNGGGKVKHFSYGLVGATAGMQVGPGFMLVGAKTRLIESNGDPKQTVVFGTYSVPVTKKLALNVNVSQSSQTIQENAAGLGVKVSF